jgi:hypothetical protein
MVAALGAQEGGLGDGQVQCVLDRLEILQQQHYTQNQHVQQQQQLRLVPEHKIQACRHGGQCSRMPAGKLSPQGAERSRAVIRDLQRKQLS